MLQLKLALTQSIGYSKKYDILQLCFKTTSQDWYSGRPAIYANSLIVMLETNSVHN